MKNKIAGSENRNSDTSRSGQSFSAVSKKNEIDMIHGPLAGKIFAMALPLAAISILQQFFNAADVAVVGNFASDTALAAVGANTPIINMFLTFFTGLATGGNVALATLIGSGQKEKVHSAIQTIYTLSLICGLAVVMIGQVIAKPILLLVNTPENVIDQACLYLRIYLFAMMFAVVYNFASAILRSKGDTKRPLYCLIASGVLNVILNLLFVIGFHLDVAGVALATLISNIVCCLASLIILSREADSFCLSLIGFELNPDTLKFTLRIGLPTGVQGMLFSISNIIIQSGINSFGADCIAGNTAACNYEFIAYFVISAFGQTSTTFVSQNFGAGEYRRCRKVFWTSMGMGEGLCFLVSMCFYLLRGFWLGFFTSSDAVLYYAGIRMLYVVMLEWVCGFNEFAASALRGQGISMVPTVISILGSCVLRILWINTIFVWYRSINTLMLVYPVSWIFNGIAALTAYFLMSRKLLHTI